MSGEKYFEVKLKRSGAGFPERTLNVLTGLGLSRMGRIVNLKDTPAVRGMLYKVVHLVDVKPHTGKVPATSARARAQQSK